MRIAIVHNAFSADSSEDEQDVWVQVQAVQMALTQLGHDSQSWACELDLSQMQKRLCDDPPDLVFNLVESLIGTGRLIHFFPGLLDRLGAPYTGAPAEALFLTSNKLTAKTYLRAAGLPTPDWAWPGTQLHKGIHAAYDPPMPADRWIIKSVWEHASIGLDDQAISSWEDAEQLNALLKSRADWLGGACFAEAFIEGREFNLSLLDSPNGPQVLPAAEIRFEGFAADKPHIVDYRAKWDTDSFEYRHTPRSFEFNDTDRPLLDQLRDLSLACWQTFELKGYARVDFRVDVLGRPWILEVNANPCLSPDAGFAAAVAQAGLSYAEAVERIVFAGLSSTKPVIPTAPSISINMAHQEALPAIRFRHEVRDQDLSAIRDLVEATGFFYPDEVEVAVELVDERLTKGDASGYDFILAEQDGRLLGYTCYGPIPCTQSSYDLYWIAVRPEMQRYGLGRRLMEASEGRIRQAGGRNVYVETSERPQYNATRRFYERCGYSRAALLPDFYRTGDGKAIYGKRLG